MERREPFVLHGQIDAWPARQWSPEVLSRLFGDAAVTARFGPRARPTGETLWEADCRRATTTLRRFTAWADGDGLLADASSEQWWGYVDYKYLFEYLADEHLRDVDWSVLGIAADATDSSAWIGTAGAYTPCHYDTYGFNLHAQLFGRKRWLLFAPEDSHLLQPQRIPLEESSVYSGANVLDAGGVRGLRRWATTLAPGDVLYVPPRWWHLVECEQTSVSVNTWVPVGGDARARRAEALTRCVGAVLQRAGLFRAAAHLNPTDSLPPLDDCLAALNRTAAAAAAAAADDDEQHDGFWRRFRHLAERVPSTDSANGAADRAHLTSPPSAAVTGDSLMNALLHPATVDQVLRLLDNNAAP